MISEQKIRLPEAFLEQMVALLGEAEGQSLIEALETSSPTSIRLNPRRGLTEPQGALARAIPYAPGAFFLRKRPSFTLDPQFHQGGYYVQEASSMLLATVAEYIEERPLQVLDLCAAPGGKTTLLLDLLPQGSTLLANEIVRQRAYVLAENVQKWGASNAIVTNTSPERLGRLRASFDWILVDAPCSGEGMFRKDPETRREWNASSPEQCSLRQRDILDDIWPALRAGGYLVYSTCTFNRLENEDIVSYLVESYGAEVLPLRGAAPYALDLGLIEAPSYRMMPHHAEGEGFFICLLRKPLEAEAKMKKLKHKPQKSALSPKLQKSARAYLDPSIDWQLESLFDSSNPTLYALRPELVPLWQQLRALEIPPLSLGVEVGLIKGDKLIPSTALVLNEAYQPLALPRVSLGREEALRYLAKEAITLPPETPRGYVVVCYQGLALGVANHLGNRSNNLYPSPWRIRMNLDSVV